MKAAARRETWQLCLFGLVMLTAVALLGSCSSSQANDGSDLSVADEPSQVHDPSGLDESEVSDVETPSPSDFAAPPSSQATTPSELVDQSSTEQPSSPETADLLPLTGRIVVIDPGHNGKNYSAPSIINAQIDAGGFLKACNTTGTASGGYSEAQLNWEVSQVLQRILQEAGATVVLTRDSNDGIGPCIDKRGGLTNEIDADVLISIHADGSAPANHGFHLIVPTATGIVSPKIAALSNHLGEQIRDQLLANDWTVSNYLGVNGIHARGDLGTLNHSSAPAILAELGNMHNEHDLAKLRSTAGQESIAQAIAAGLIEFFR